MKKAITQFLPHLLIVFIFIVLSFAYFYPVLEGKEMPQMDNIHAKGMSNELVQFEKNNPGEESQWTNSMFGGMPAYQIKGGETFNIFLFLQRTLRLGMPFTTVAILFIYLLGFYILLTSLNVNKWLSLAGSVAFGLTSYNIIIIAAGHITKTYAIAYMAPVLAGVILTYNKKYWLGGLLTAIALGIEISTNHPQITYYLALTVGLLVIFKLVQSYREKELKHFGIATAIVVSASVMAVLPNITQLWTTYEYGKYSTRGQSELSINQENKSSGLDRGYALAWSYGTAETFSLLIPNVVGGATGSLGENKTAMEKVSPEMRETIAGQNHYWGNQPFTSGPVYVGAIICFLFVLGLFIVDGSIKWWLLTATILSIILSWGRNFPAFNDFFFYNFPMYNKFRTVSMTLVVASVTMPLLAILAVKKIVEDPKIIFKTKYQLWTAFGVTGGLALVFWLMPSAFFSFMSGEELSQINSMKTEQPQYAGQIAEMVKNLEIARIAIFKADAIRSFLFIALGLGTLVLFSLNYIKKEIFFGLLAILILADLWIVDRRYLNSEPFQKKSIVRTAEFPKTAADEFILKDTDPNCRVLNLTQNVFNDGYTPYYHKTIGGYHGAKLKRYQEVIDYYLGNNVQNVRGAIQKNLPSDQLNMVIGTQSVLNMLNTKYIIYDTKSMPIINFNALGHAWFVDNYQLVNDANEEMKALGTINPKNTAVINKKFTSVIGNLPKAQIFSQDSGIIVLTSYKPNHLTYKAATTKDKLAVFSEIYYPAGWNAYIDSKKVEHLNVNYILRGLVIPAGQHKIEFKFEPVSYYTGKTISLIGSILILLLIVGFAGKYYLEQKKLNTEKEVVKK